MPRGVYKGEGDWKRAISAACRVKNYGTFSEGDNVYYSDRHGDPTIYLGIVSNWGEYWDYWESLPGDWQKSLPYQVPGQEDPKCIFLTEARTKPPHLEPPPQCTKEACRKGRCAGPDWCTCHCNHWWE